MIPEKVTLTNFEIFIAASVGARRRIDTIVHGRKPTREQPEDDPGWDSHILGALGEMAAAKALKVYWSFSVNTFQSEPDVADYEVKTASRDNWPTLLLPQDTPEAAQVVFVTGIGPVFKVYGWICAADGKKKEWLYESKTKEGQKKRPPFYRVPKKIVRDIKELKKK